MAKGEAKKNNQLLDTELKRTQDQNQGWQNQLTARLPQAQQRADESYGKIDKGYDDLSAAFGRYGDSGGWNPSDLKGVQGDISSLRGFAKNSVSPTDQARMRGGGVYDEFSKTGGLDEQARSNLRARGNSNIPSFYNAVSDELHQQNNAQGGYNPGFGSQMAKLAREQGHASQDAALNTELGITDQVNKGRQWGAEGMTSSESTLQDLLSRNFLNGTTAANSAAMNLNQSQNQAKQFGLSGQNAVQSGRTGLRSSTSGEEQALYDQIGKAMGMSSDEISRLIQQRIGNNPNVSTWDRIAQLGQTAGPLAAGFMTGGASGMSGNFASGSGLFKNPKPVRY